MSFVAPFLCSDLVRVRQSSCKFIINFSKKPLSTSFFLKKVVFCRFSVLYDEFLVQIARFLEFFGGKVALIPPCLSEASDEGFFEELIDGHLELLTQVTGGLADVPFVDIDGGNSTHFRETDGIEGAGDGLLPMETSATIGGVDGAESASSFIFHEHAVLAVDDLGDEFPILVGIDDAFRFYLLLGFGREVVVEGLVGFLEEFHLFHRDGRTGIAFDATGTVAFFQVAAEEYFEEVERDEGVEDFKHGRGAFGIGLRRQRIAVAALRGCQTPVLCGDGAGVRG